MSDQPPKIGPWAEGITAAERCRRWRQTAGAAMILCGERSPLVRACIAAETDPHAAELAWRELGAIDPQRREYILSSLAVQAAPDPSGPATR
jgi:hypothetical protein